MKYLPIPLFIALQAAVMMIIEPKLEVTSDIKFVAWIAFQAWAMYFLAGCDIKGGAKTLIGYFCGIVASVAIIELAGVVSSVPVAVFIVVIFVISAEKVPGIDFVPAWFIGAGMFFGLVNIDAFAEGATMMDKYIQSTGRVMYSCLVGLIFGYVTVTVRGWYEAKIAAPADAPEADAETA